MKNGSHVSATWDKRKSRPEGRGWGCCCCRCCCCHCSSRCSGHIERFNAAGRETVDWVFLFLLWPPPASMAGALLLCRPPKRARNFKKSARARPLFGWLLLKCKELSSYLQCDQTKKKIHIPSFLPKFMVYPLVN